MLLSIINHVLKNNDLNRITAIEAHLRLREDLDLDSIMLAELTVRIEDHYDVDIFEKGMVITVGDIVLLLEEYGKEV